MVKYIVQPGDTLGNIAVKYRTTVQAIVRANGIKDPNMIHTGQIIRIPTKYYHDDMHHHSHHHGKYPGKPGNPHDHDDHYYFYHD